MLRFKILAPHDLINDIIAAIAIVSPAWLPSLTTISSEAGLLLPIMGVLWLGVQIYAKLRFRKGDDD